eukprot:11355551-Alexandrium_andersonii.AAC.1
MRAPASATCQARTASATKGAARREAVAQSAVARTRDVDRPRPPPSVERLSCHCMASVGVLIWRRSHAASSINW